MLQESPKVNTIITDASCFILFDNIGCLDVLQRLYLRVVTTPEIAKEYGKSLPEWVIVKSVENLALLNTYSAIVALGEASAIALAIEVVSPLLILDDLKGRKLAESFNLAYTGTIGVLISAKKQGIIHSLKPYFEKIAATDFRIPANFLKTLLVKYDR